jgi:hypothetical protein
MSSQGSTVESEAEDINTVERMIQSVTTEEKLTNLRKVMTSFVSSSRLVAELAKEISEAVQNYTGPEDDKNKVELYYCNMCRDAVLLDYTEEARKLYVRKPKDLVDDDQRKERRSMHDRVRYIWKQVKPLLSLAGRYYRYFILLLQTCIQTYIHTNKQTDTNSTTAAQGMTICRYRYTHYIHMMTTTTDIDIQTYSAYIIVQAQQVKMISWM